MATPAYPQVALFGAMGGGWREAHVIPALEALGVTYHDPTIHGRAWTEADGLREAEVMAHAETIVMVFPAGSPAFGGLAETGWAAASAHQRGQTFILHVAPDFTWEVAGWLRRLPGARGLVAQVEEYGVRARALVADHARRLAGTTDRLIVAESMAEVVAALRRRYGAG